MNYRVRNNRRERPVSDPVTKIVLHGTKIISEENLLKLTENPVLKEMLGFDEDKKTFAGSALLTVTKLDAAGKPVTSEAISEA